MKLHSLVVAFVLCSSVDNSVQDGYEAKRPQFFPIYPRKMDVQHRAGFQHTKGGVQAAYRNDQRQEYVNNLAYKLGTGLGTAPWYGVPGTAYDFRHSHSAGPTYDTDASSPKGYGYQASVPQYHSQPSYGHSGGGGGGYGAPAHKSGSDMKPTGSCGGYAEPQTKITDTAVYQLATKKAAPYASMVDAGGYRMPMESKGYTDVEQGHSANHGKVGYDGMPKNAGYMAGSYETLGYGYMY